MELAIFKNNSFGEVRAFNDENNQAWFVANDVCSILNLDNISRAIDSLDIEDKTVLFSKTATSNCLNDFNGLRKDTRLISESGLYALIFQSRKEEAKAFKKWITKEVIPSIRKTGGYLMSAPDETPEQVMARALLVAQDTIDRTKRQLESAKDKIAQDKPKVDFYEAVTECEGTIDIAQAAKVLRLNVGRNGLYQELRNRKILDNKNIPYQEYINRGYFRVIEKVIDTPKYKGIGLKTLVLQKGVDFIYKVFGENKESQQIALCSNFLA